MIGFTRNDEEQAANMQHLMLNTRVDIKRAMLKLGQITGSIEHLEIMRNGEVELLANLPTNVKVPVRSWK